MLGGLYPPETLPAAVRPAGSAPAFDGLTAGLWNPQNASYFTGSPPVKMPLQQAASKSTVPDPDPEEIFVNVTYQLYGPPGPAVPPQWPMLGFYLNYVKAIGSGSANPQQIMQCHAPAQLPVLTALATNYAVSDAWFASVPSQTWPNRAFVHSGTSNGHVDNDAGLVPDPWQWDVPTIFNVLDSIGASWSVYSDTMLTPSLTRTMMPKLWTSRFDGNFQGLTAFLDDCKNNGLPAYSFVEPSFLVDPNDQHPPHDVLAGEAFLYAIWEAVSTSPGWNETLLIITYDEHGGCFDHVLPPTNATPPDSASTPGDQGFGFDRFGVRVPAVVISPYIAPGTVFRSDTNVPYDHTSILATLRDWIGIDNAAMLPSARAKAAPTLAQLLTLQTPRTALPNIPAPAMNFTATPVSTPANDLQKSLVSGTARRFGLDPQTEMNQIQTRQHAIDFFKRHSSHLY
jgi:phospholipase C